MFPSSSSLRGEWAMGGGVPLSVFLFPFFPASLVILFVSFCVSFCCWGESADRASAVSTA